MKWKWTDCSDCITLEMRKDEPRRKTNRWRRLATGMVNEEEKLSGNSYAEDCHGKVIGKSDHEEEFFVERTGILGITGKFQKIMKGVPTGEKLICLY